MAYFVSMFKSLSSFIILMIYWMIPALVNCQEIVSDQKAVFQFGLSYHKASTLIHSNDLRVIGNSDPNGLELDLAWQQRKRETWEKCHCFPKMGVTLVAWDYDRPDILGYGFSALFFVEPEYNAARRVSFSIKGGYGISYLSKPYELTNNPDNQAYSMNFAFALFLAAKLNVKLGEQSGMHLGLFFNHNSNGGIKKPNRGLNYPSVSIGYSRYLEPPNFQGYGKTRWDRSSRQNRLDVTALVSLKQPESGIILLSPGMEIKVSRQVGKINALTLGAEFLSDQFLRYKLDQVQSDEKSEKISLAVGHEFLLGKLIFSQQIGVYVYKPYKSGADVYQRYGLSYRFWPWLRAGINMKSHGHVADLVDFRLTYSFLR